MEIEVDREVVVRHLAQAEAHAAQGEIHLARQRQIVHELARDGHDTRLAKELLETFEMTQAGHRVDVARLQKELEDGSYDLTGHKPAAQGYDFRNPPSAPGVTPAPVNADSAGSPRRR